MKTSVTGFPRIGKNRELKFASEKYFRGEISEAELLEAGRAQREYGILTQKEAGIDLIPVNDFSFYDNVLDTAFLFNVVPARYKELGLSPIDTYFAAARGYQGEKGNVKALAMKKWFNTNYHYIVPEFEDGTEISLSGTKPVDALLEAKALGVEAKVQITGPFTFLKLLRFTGSSKAEDIAGALVSEYVKLFGLISENGGSFVQLDEPWLVRDLTDADIALFKKIYSVLLSGKKGLKIILQTYFGDIRDAYETVTSLDFDAIALDFVEGRKTLELVKTYGFPKGKTLIAGIVNGKNIWKNDYSKSKEILDALKAIAAEDDIIIGTSCSLLHVPYTLKSETKLKEEYKAHFAFAEEKLLELKDLSSLNDSVLSANKALFAGRPDVIDNEVKARVSAIKDEDYTRLPVFEERVAVQNDILKLPLFPTTTIGSFPQTDDVRKNRRAFKNGEISKDQYVEFNKGKIKECIELQEKLGLDVLVHGEYERNDMVEYFGEHLSGYLFTEKAWVLSYGTRCVKPPIIWGDVSRKTPITVEWSKYAQSLTDKPVKGMLTGPVTILNWSFPREDISIKESILQIALAIRDGN